jgi:NADH dehydrogenase
LTRLRHPARAAGKKIVVIIGGGFAGLRAARRLANESGIHVVLIDRRNHHLFQPLLYQVATAGLNPADIAVAIRSQFTDAPNVDVHLGKVDGVDLEAKLVYGGDVEIEYDYLVVATGSQHSYFGRDDWEQYAPGLKTLEQATEIRRRLLFAFEAAENELDPSKQAGHLTFVVVGGGPTGVELAGAIADISRTVMVRDFRRIDPRHARIILVEGAPRILGAFSEELAARAHRDLEDMGVEVRTGCMVEHIDGDGVVVNGERIAAESVIWAAGVQASPLAFRPAVPTDRAGRVMVGPDLSLPGRPEVFVVGDMAALEIPGGMLPGVAPAALQTGGHAAEMIAGDVRGQGRRRFFYNDKGIMATIGKSRAIVQRKHARMTGRLAWFAWLFVHIFYLIGFKNRMAVMWEWVWAYLFSTRGARLITDRDWRLRPP